MSTVRRAWRRLWAVDPLLADSMLALLLTLGSLLGAIHLRLTYGHPSVGQILLSMGTTIFVAGRRRYPLPCLVLQSVSQTAAGLEPTLAGYVALFTGIYSVGVYARWRWLGLAYVVASGLFLLRFVLPSNLTPPGVGAAWVPVATIGIWLIGEAIRSNRARAAALEDRAERLERERQLAAQVAAGEERARIARELHDVVAHSVSVMVVQAGAARQVLSRQPDRAAQALQAVEGAGREALSELRHLLDLLSQREDEAALTPQPGMAELESLIDRVRGAGLPVELRVDGEPRPLPPGVALAAFRVVQEALTNALKYSGCAPTQVLVRYDARDLRLEIIDSGKTVPTGLPGRGLLGMRERVAVYGGEFDAGRRAGAGYAVRVRLPLAE
jgi:signal transduction histidine kinase